MKKILAMLLVAILAFSATAFAATYRHDDDIAFEYDENAIEITSEVHNDDEHRIVMGYKEKAWGDGYITIQLADLPDGQGFPTREELAESMGIAADAFESMPTWANFKDVVTTSVTAEGKTETVFIAPVYDHDGEVEDILTVIIATSELDDQEAAQNRDDTISAIVDTLKVDD